MKAIWVHKSLFVLFLLISILSLQACNSKNENPLLGRWISENKIMQVANPDYQEVQLEFGTDFLKIDDKKIPVIYKIKQGEIVLFSRGEKVTAYMLSEKKMILFLRNLGKRVYIKQN